MHIVVSRPLKKHASCERNYTVEVAAGADIGLVSIIMDPSVSHGVRAANLLRCIRGCIVGDDQLKIRVVLAQNGIQGRAEIIFSIVHGHSYAHFRNGGVHLISLRFGSISFVPLN